MVRFAKNGSDATSGAVRAARAFTKRNRVAICGYHGWHDWYIGTTSRFAGVPGAVRDLSHTFPYNDLDALDKVLASHPDEFAAVIMEPFNFVWPAEGYLAGVKELAHKHGAILIFDEICTGFHFGLGGAQKMFGVLPDPRHLRKAMGNGYAISCVVGRRDIMQIFNDIFMSFTFAGDVSAMDAQTRSSTFWKKATPTRGWTQPRQRWPMARAFSPTFRDSAIVSSRRVTRTGCCCAS
jgi:glutamate-1-semialdehyde aminotransferase